MIPDHTSSAGTSKSTGKYHITTNPPSGTEYLHLRSISGLSRPPVSPEQAEEAIRNSIYCLVARAEESGEAIGMLRLLGDGHIFLSIYDMCVVPSWRGQGVAGCMFDRLMMWIDKEAPHAYVSLFADPPGRGLYGKRGFEEPAGSVGMVRIRGVWERG